MSRGKGLKESPKKDYISSICESLKYDCYQEHQRLANAGSCAFIVQDVAKFRAERTFQVEWDGLPAALEHDWVTVHQVGSAEKVARGMIGRIKDNKIKIILDGKPKIEEKKEKEKKQEKEEKTEDAAQKFEVQLDVARFDGRALRFACAIDKLAQFTSRLQNNLLNHFEERSNTKYLQTRMLNLANSPKLSKKQCLAVEQSLMKRISLIEGVAGSGKTLVAATIALSMSRTREKRRRVLLCSPLQSTVNELTKILSHPENGVTVVQLTPNSIIDRCNVPQPCLKEVAKKDAKHLWFTRMEKHQVTPRKIRPYVSKFQINRTERARLVEADIVCCTLEQTTQSDCLYSMDFKALVIDDAHYAKEYECLLALRFKSIKQVTLIGDMRRSEQLLSNSLRSGRNRSLERRRKSHYDRRYSFISDTRLRRSLASEPNGLDRHQHNLGGRGAEIGSLFDRCLVRGLPSVVLKFRYRRLDKLDVFLRQHFYSFGTASLAAIGRKVSTELLPSTRLAWPPRGPIMFDIKSESFDKCLSRITEDIRKWDKTASICMIMNHDPETRKQSQEGFATEVGCINDFLGQQRDYVILVCRRIAESRVKRKSRMKNDFLSQDDALMVALTRACHNLFVITDLSETIQNEIAGNNWQPAGEGWKSLVQYFGEENLILQEYPNSEQENRAGSSKASS